VVESKSQSTLEDKNTQPLSSMLNRLRTQQRSDMMDKFGGIYQGYKSCWFDNLTEFDDFVFELMKLDISYKSKILKKRGMPTQYLVMLLE